MEDDPTKTTKLGHEKGQPGGWPTRYSELVESRELSAPVLATVPPVAESVHETGSALRG